MSEESDNNVKTEESEEETKEETKEETEKKDKEDTEEMEESEEKEPTEEEDEPPEKEEKEEVEPTEKEDEVKPKNKKYTNWPLREIKEPHENDVLYGRGGGTNHHPGNKRYRKIVEDKKLDYVNSKRLDKPLVALEIIRAWRAQEPPGRFLKNNEKTGLWEDVGDKKAREKTSQALREKAPELRRKQEEEEEAKHQDETGEDSNDAKTTRFAEGTSDKRMNSVKRSVLARDHSLGREYIQAGEAVTLDGFTWTNGPDGRSMSTGSLPGISYPMGRNTSSGSTGVPPHHYGPSRTESHSTVGPPPPHGYYDRNLSGMSSMSMGAPMDDRSRQYSSGGGRYESWGRIPSGNSLGGGSMGQLPPMGPPQPIPYSSGGHYQSGDYGPGPPSGPHGSHMGREHSLSGVSLRDASISHPAAPFERHGSGYWAHPTMPPPPPHGMPGQYPPSGRYMSNDSGYGQSRNPSGEYDPMNHHPSMGPSSAMPHGGDMGYGHSRTPSGIVFDPMMTRSPPDARPSHGSPSYGPPHRKGPSYGPPPGDSPVYSHIRTPSGNTYDPMISRTPPSSGPPAPRSPAQSSPVGQSNYDVDPAIGQTWSSQSDDYEKVASIFGREMSSSWSGQTQNQSFPQPIAFLHRGHESDSTGLKYAGDMDDLPRPDMVKRMTSNQNEDESNKRGLAGGSVKRAALNRDSSAAANALKARYIPEVLQRPGVIKNREVSVQEMDSLQDSLEQSNLGVDKTRPRALTVEERMSTIDQITNDLMAKPLSLRSGHRTSTIEALALDLDIDTDSGDKPISRRLSRPPTLRTEDRLSTAEYLDIVNEPLGLDDSAHAGSSVPAIDLSRDVSVSEWLSDTDI